MKLIIGGSTGFVGSEIVRQSCRHSKITSIVALARSHVQPPSGAADVFTLHPVLVDSYDTYSSDVRQHFVDADACIWNVAITPRKSRDNEVPFEEVKRVCHDNALAGFQAMVDARGESGKPFRFVYVSGYGAERDQTKTPPWMPEYCLMRGQTENELLALAEKYKGVQVGVAKPGLITAPERKESDEKTLKENPTFPYVARSDLVAAMIDQCVNGFEKEPLLNDDLVRIGQQVA